MPDNPASTSSASMRVAVAGTLEYRDQNGNVIGTATMTGTLPLVDSSPTTDAPGGKDHGLDYHP